MRAKIVPHADGYTLHGTDDEEPVSINFGGVQRAVIIAAGKAAASMLQSLLHVVLLPEGRVLSGVLIAPERPLDLPEGFDYFSGGHPLPSATSFAAAQAALALVREAAAGSEPSFCFFLLSGGSSAMMELPLGASITLDDTIAFHRALVLCGASIEEINCVRKHFSAVKGGRLGAAAAAMQSITLAVSDVPAGRLDVLASGPTLPDPSTVAECREIIARYELLGQFPARVRDFFASGIPETPKPGAFTARVLTLLSDRDLAAAAKRAAEAMGFYAEVDETTDNWEYNHAAVFLLDRLKTLRAQHGRVCLIASGETVVKVPADARGMGGRNQQFALYAATLLAHDGHPIAILSTGTDGIDGNSRFAGAVVDEQTLCEPGNSMRLHLKHCSISMPPRSSIRKTQLSKPGRREITCVTCGCFWLNN